MKTFLNQPRPEDLIHLLGKYGSPLVVVSEAIIRERCQWLKAAFPKSVFHYAAKANYNPSLLKIIKDEGFGIDAVSPNEVELALRCGFDPKSIIYIENNMTDEDMEYSMEKGVKLVIGSLSRLQKYVEKYPNTQVGIRINGDVGAAHHAKTFTAGPASKFGIHYTQTGTALEIASANDVKITTVQQHIGSGWLDTQPFLEAIEVLFKVAETMPEVTHLDFGGGFGVPYRPTESHLNYQMLKDQFADKITAFEKKTGWNFSTSFEPGRIIAAESSVLLGTCNTRKEGADGRVFIGTDSGFNHLVRPAMYDSYHHIINLSNLEGEPETVDVCGNLCESSDFFARDRDISQVQEGHVLAVMDVGAYGLAQGSPYNLRGFPAEVLLKEDGSTVLIRQRQTFEDLMAGFEF